MQAKVGVSEGRRELPTGKGGTGRQGAGGSSDLNSTQWVMAGKCYLKNDILHTNFGAGLLNGLVFQSIALFAADC